MFFVGTLEDFKSLPKDFLESTPNQSLAKQTSIRKEVVRPNTEPNHYSPVSAD